MKSRRIKLYISISGALILLTSGLIGVLAGYLYWNNSRLAIASAEKSMAQSSRDVVRSLEELLRPVGRIVDNTAFLIERGATDFRSMRGINFLYKQVAALPRVYSMYVGYESDGSFYQVVRIPERNGYTGPSGKAPFDSRYVVRILDDSSGAPADSFIYLEAWGEIMGVDRGPVKYDPRKRPWYLDAQERKKITVSDVYNFQSTGKPGLTVAKTAYAVNGQTLATAGVDITLDGLIQFLNAKRVGKRGRTFILDKDGGIVVQSSAKVPADNGDQSHFVEALSDVQVLAAISRYKKSGQDTFVFGEGDKVMAAFLPFPDDFEKLWVVGEIADQAEFVEQIKEVTIRVLEVAAVLLLIGIVAIAIIANRMIAPLQHVVAETDNIRRFELEKDFNLRSTILEIDELARAIASMKNSLRSFGAYVPVALVRNIVSSGTSVSIGGEERELTIMFSDIESFTSKTEDLSSDAVFSELSIYCGEVTKSVRAYRGTVDKFIGDGVMAFWNAPLDDDDHAANGIRAGLACIKASAALNAERGVAQMAPISTRIGLHTGEVIVGNVGSDDRMQYTALGSPVNVASRIEAINKEYGTYLLITGAVAERISGFLMRPVDVIAPYGITKPIPIYEVFGETADGADNPPTEAQKAMCEKWQQCYAAYQKRDWPDAAEAFRNFASDYPDDTLAKIYVARCETFIETPPAADWDGVLNYETK